MWLNRAATMSSHAFAKRQAPDVGKSRGVGPQLPFCYLCGRQFGSSSLPIHMRACKAKWERERGALPPEPELAATDPCSGEGIFLAVEKFRRREFVKAA